MCRRVAIYIFIPILKRDIINRHPDKSNIRRTAIYHVAEKDEYIIRLIMYCTYEGGSALQVKNA